MEKDWRRDLEQWQGLCLVRPRRRGRDAEGRADHPRREQRRGERGPLRGARSRDVRATTEETGHEDAPLAPEPDDEPLLAPGEVEAAGASVSWSLRFMS